MSVREKRSKIVKQFFALFVFAGSAFFVSPETGEAKEWKVFIHRVQIAGNATDEDFVEIRNDEDCALDLSDWKLRKRTSSGTESSIKVFDGNRTSLPPGESFLWANSKNDFAKSLDAHQESSAMLTDNNSLALFNADEILIDTLSWGTVSAPFQKDEPSVTNPEKNESILRTSKTSPAMLTKTELPSGKTFDIGTLDFCGVSKDRANGSALILSEILANPVEDEAEGEFIELENTSEKTIDLSGWILRDASKTGKYTFPEGGSFPPASFLVLTRKTFVFALNNTDETVTLFDPKGTRADSVSWKKSRENISLARNGANWRNTKFLTPKEKNLFGNDPSTKATLPKRGFVGIPLSFSTKVSDRDKDATTVTWNFGDGRRSYKKETTHTFTKKGRYTITLTATDGIADTEKTFRVEIKKYEAPKIRIVSLVPNPAGADAKNEYILLTNHSNKSVNLKGWKIATKSKRTTKNFVNHTIAKDFVIQPGASKKLTAKNTAITLGNTRQYLELRDPRGKTVQSLRYKLGKSAPENAELFKEPNQPWQWRNPLPLDTKIEEV